jgi:hypothetical protein
MKRPSILLRQTCLFLGALFTAVSLISSSAAPLEVTQDHPALRAALTVQAAATPELLKWPHVVGTAISSDDAGQAVLVVFVDRDGAAHADVVQALPPQLGGIPTRAELTDKFRAFGKPGGTGGGGAGISHVARQNPPISLGTSGGWRFDLANGYCCGGTLGSLIQVNGVQYILSNYHVLEADIIPGGNGLIAATGNPVIQPGLIDVSCNANNSQDIATLVRIGALPNSNVDAAIAQVAPGMVRTDGTILEIGMLSAQIAAASLNQGVKKSGRTTGLTRSKISGLNATIVVSYENECAGGAAFTKTYSGQIMIVNSGSKFLNSGDSGSLLVEDVASSPRAVGLLYAGSSTTAVANPIGEVLDYIGAMLGAPATMVGN